MNAMGSFIGHAVPGLMFFLTSIWWLVGALRLTFLHQTANKHQPLIRRRHNKGHFPQHRVVFTIRRCKLPLEPLAKVLLSMTGMVGELLYEKQWVLLGDNGFVYKHLNNYAHLSMYCMFALSGIVDLLMHYNSVPLPTGLDHVFLSLAFFVEGMLFYFHLDGRPKLNVRLHTFVYLISFLTSLVLLAEMKAARSPIPVIARAFLTTLQGSWFFQIAFVLHGYHPWKNSPENIEFIAIAFVWHILGTASLYLVIFVAAYRGVFVRQRDKEQEMESHCTDEELEFDS